jgi:hypothetical protein
MTNPTSNFGWQMPTPTDLVTDLPADFEVFGQAVDTSLADLKGGTTGQVLKKNTNADMDFVWAADAAGMTNPMTTTGDTIYSSSGSTPARLGIGTTGQVLTVAAGIPSWSTPVAGVTFSGARVSKTSTQSIPNATTTILSFNNEIIDVGGYHDNSTNNSRLTIPTGKGGYVLISGKVHMRDNANGFSEVLIQKNGSLIGSNAYKNTATYYSSPHITLIASCVAGDFFELGIWQDTGGNNICESGETTTNFMITYLGA